MDANTDIRAKLANGAAVILNFPGVAGNPGLILNGGALNPGDDGVFEYQGRIHVASDSVMALADNGLGTFKPLRGNRFNAVLTGTGAIIVLQGTTNLASMEVVTANNPYSGTWIVKAGYLKGSAVGALGTGNILIDPNYTVSGALINPSTALSNGPAILEVTYDLNSAGTLTLNNAGKMNLHQNVRFAAMTINGAAVPLGVHPYSELLTSYPNNFLPGGSGSINVAPPSPPPTPANVVAISGDAQVRLSWTGSSIANSYWVLRGDASGGPYNPLANPTSSSYLDTAVVNGGTYYYVIQATNGIGASPNSAEVVGTPNFAVSGVTAVGGTAQVVLNWNSLAQASSYSVKRASTSGGPYTTLASGVTDTTYTDAAVENGRRYFYVIIPQLTAGGDGGVSNEASASTAPNAPVLTVSLFVSSVANLSWTISDPVITSFLIERSDNGADFAQIATVAGTARKYQATGLGFSSVYAFRIRAANDGGPSDYSNEGSVTTPSFGVHVNFAAGAGNSAGNPVAPTVPGYLQDIGMPFADQGNGYSYGWDRNLVADGRYRQLANSPDLRYDTFMHMIKATPPAIWNIAIPNGFYAVHIVAGDPQNLDSVFQFDVEGVITDTITPGGAGSFSNNWGDFNVTAVVNDGQMTIKSGPNSQTTANNNKIDFIDIVAAIPEEIEIGAQPQSQSVEESRRVTLSVTVAHGSTPLTYQWYKDGSSIQDATNRTLFFAHAQQSDTGDYFVEITNPAGTVTSDTATLLVSPDTTPPNIVSAYSLDGSKIKVIWNEPLDPASGGDPVSYHVEGASVNTAVLLPDEFGDSNIVVLTVSGLTTLTFDIGASGFGIYDPFGNLQGGDPLYTGKVFAPGSGLTDDGIVGTAADPIEKGSTTVDPNHLEVVAGGSDIWNAADGFRYVYGQYANDFDLKVRISRLDPRDNWSKAGFVVRQDLTPGSPDISAVLTPSSTALDGTGAGANDFEAGTRLTVGAATTDYGVAPRPTNSFPYTNAWIRLQRAGNSFTAYRGTNGSDWISFGTTTQTYPGTVYVGLGTTAHNNGPGQTTTAVYEDFARILPPSIVTQPQTQSVNQGSPVTFTVAATGEAPFSYQWRKDNVIIPGATSDTYTISSVQPNDAGDYDVVVSNVDSSTSSLKATLAVRVAPSITTAPQSQTVSCWPVTFSVAAVGTPTLTYQWRKGTVNIPGANDNTYTIASVTAADAGSYNVVVGNDVGSATSDDAILTVADIITITCPANIVTSCTSPSGATVSFSPTTTDDCDPSPTVKCTPASGSVFPAGLTTVNCTATNASASSASCSFTVTVHDGAPPNVSIAYDGSTVIISWPQTCTTYRVTNKSALDDPQWVATPGTVQAVGGNYELRLSPDAPHKFFRLQAP